ncbi:Ppx/GppA phosphatase family protein [Deinococcus sonorensis]|uniref:Ppx/GppA phosphatase family protein n=2 Tax=Deinococcus sonorensis TaxID=309891 RepID=A0AAU7UBW0_9DEIO
MQRVAVADVGTNSCHLLIAEARPGGFRVLDSLKDRTRLGECLDAHGITAEGERRLAAALGRFRELATSLGAPELRVYATSAMRGAPNGEAVARRLREQIGVYPVIISGEREGQLTYLGAAGSVEFGSDNLLLDLGGGSLELARGDQHVAASVLSLPLGSVRMRLAHLHHDPPRQRELRALEAQVRTALTGQLDPYRVRAGTRVFGSSGTFEALAGLLAARRGGAATGINGLSFRVPELGEVLEELRGLSPTRRGRMPGLDPRRADIIVAGAAVLHTVLTAVGASTVTVSEGALREGMLREELGEQDRWSRGLSARQRSVLEMAERFSVSLPHARQVTQLSQQLYDRLRDLGRLPDSPHDPRSLLSTAAMLHETGLLVAQSSHHKHSAYLIRHAGLRGYDPQQLDRVAQIARYHRKSPPKASHPEYAALPPAGQQQVARLAAILRVADALDRSHAQAVRIERLTPQGPGLRLTVGGAGPLEQEGLRQKADLWQQVYGPLTLDPLPGQLLT